MIEYGLFDREFASKIMKEHDSLTEVDSIFERILYGITVLHNGEKSGIAYVTKEGKQICLHGYKNGKVKTPIRESVRAGIFVCNQAMLNGYKHICCVIDENERLQRMLLKRIGFEFKYSMCNFDIYLKQLR